MWAATYLPHQGCLEPPNQCFAWRQAAKYYLDEYKSLSYEADQAYAQGNFLEGVTLEEAESIALEQGNEYVSLINDRC